MVFRRVGGREGECPQPTRFHFRPYSSDQDRTNQDPADEIDAETDTTGIRSTEFQEIMGGIRELQSGVETWKKRQSVQEEHLRVLERSIAEQFGHQAQIFLSGPSTGGGSLADQIIRLIDDTYHLYHDQQIPSFRFPCPPDQVGSVLDELLLKLDDIGLRNAARFEYDYQSHIALLDMSESGESQGHSLIGWKVNTILDRKWQRAALGIDNVVIQNLTKWITCLNTAVIHLKGKLLKMPDGSFGSIHGGLKVSLVCEVS
ncbi:hypothetical protein B0H67DRAFT_642062 [Lasiosphaeris hirsuta]|uniref:Uncharacterized protein n=1 Tax=Lasiosphaeris hirsuta TaxID=260670 RepID=A0AA40B136_9PEZI|nr:hypothetical protein B0H67DRAFT_642062 [Lasiosphaeris hirsuta]